MINKTVSINRFHETEKSLFFKDLLYGFYFYKLKVIKIEYLNILI
ncbi:hypothetical protein LEP1GSC073_4354 [Leptospira noguchii str. Cascata]|nr:hypothetical protein LEP1GSC072_2645 [Leptospira noguchii str. Bonito]EMS88304.1 hypothetical protein LEP1GSC073_4354 [Leptospira noguchii str. Cascata]